MERGLSPANIILLVAIVIAEDIKRDREQPHKDSEVRENLYLDKHIKEPVGGA